jgi:hypothetical protein
LIFVFTTYNDLVPSDRNQAPWNLYAGTQADDDQLTIRHKTTQSIIYVQDAPGLSNRRNRVRRAAGVIFFGSFPMHFRGGTPSCCWTG